MPNATAPAALPAEATPAGSGRPMLVEFAVLWTRGLADPVRLWDLFDRAALFMQVPDYFGAPIVRHRGMLVTPVFSTPNLLAQFVTRTTQRSDCGPPTGSGGVQLGGADFFALPVRARYLLLDPGSQHATLIDLAARDPLPTLANAAPPVAVNIELHPDGPITSGPITAERQE